MHTHSMCGVLHPHSHDHGHGHGHGHDHGHGKKKVHDHSVENGHNIDMNEVASPDSGQHRRHWLRWKKKSKHGSLENINVRAAFIHVIGDLIQSIGVVIAGYIIKFKVNRTPEPAFVVYVCT